MEMTTTLMVVGTALSLHSAHCARLRHKRITSRGGLAWRPRIVGTFASQRRKPGSIACREDRHTPDGLPRRRDTVTHGGNLRSCNFVARRRQVGPVHSISSNARYRTSAIVSV